MCADYHDGDVRRCAAVPYLYCKKSHRASCCTAALCSGKRDDFECAPRRFAHNQRKHYFRFRVWSDRVCGAQRSNESPSGAFKRQSGLRLADGGGYPDKLCGALQTHFHRWGRYGKRQLQRHFLRKRGASGIPGHHFIKQKSHRFCISASTMASYWSGRRGSNSLPPPWQGGALPDELRPHIRCIYPCTLPSDSCEFRGPRESLRSKILWGKGENLVFITEVLLARLPDE